MSQRLDDDKVLNLSPGEIVRVRSAAEIFSTLDEHGRLDGMPFMPEMLKYCGRTLPVYKRADKTCDGHSLRRMKQTVHLSSIRCDGASHGGCQAACLMYWKEAWLERVEQGSANGAPGPDARETVPDLDANERAFVTDTLLPATTTHDAGEVSTQDAGEGKDLTYRCQATEIPNASTPIYWRHLGQYPRDVRNWGVLKLLRGWLVDVFNTFQRVNRKFLPRLTLFRGGLYYPFVAGELVKGQTPSARLDLKPGDWVRIKSKDEILKTLDHSNRNRGLTFDVEMVPYCGRTARVFARVERLVDEHTGKMVDIKSDCIILGGVVCKADFHRSCTRSTYPYWREIWLEKIIPDPRHGGSGSLSRNTSS